MAKSIGEISRERTPAQRKAAAAKMVATKKANKFRAAELAGLEASMRRRYGDPLKPSTRWQRFVKWLKS